MKQSSFCLPEMTALSIALLCAGLQTAHSQTTSTSETESLSLDEVVVTAQKQTEKLADVTVSAAVVSANSLLNTGVSNLDDLGKAVPSLVASSSSSNLRSGYTMRGISTSVITIGAPSGTAVMIDGVTLAPESMAARQLADIENVEVLRGPQATLGGRTAASGVINMVTRSPTNVFGGNVSVTLTDDNERRLQGFVSGPMTDTLAFSLSGYTASTEFPTKNLANGKHDREQANGGRGKLLFKPTDELDITLTAALSTAKNRGTFTTYIQIDPTANFRGSVLLPQRVALPGITVNRDNFNYQVIDSPHMNGNDHFFSLVANYKVGDFILSSITAYQKEDRTLVADLYSEAADSAAIINGPPYAWDMTQKSVLDVKTTSQEFKVVSPQFGLVKFLGGLYFDHDATDFDFVRNSFTNGGSGPPPFVALRTADTKTYALYARATWTLVPDKLDLITGVRVNRDDISYVYNLRANNPPAAPGVPFTRVDSAAANTTVGDVSLRYKITHDVMVYGSYTKGYKPAIWNLDGTVTPTNTFVPVLRENIDALELGLKGSFLNNRLSLNAAVFDTVYKDFQVQTFDPNAVSATFAIANAGKAHTRGVELDVRAILPADIRLNSSIAYVDAKYDKYDRANCYGGQTAATGCIAATPAYQVLTGHALPNAPKWKGTLGIEKMFRLDMPFNVTVNGNYVYQTKVNFDPNLNPAAIQDSYGIFNLSVGLVDQSERYSATLFVNNALDEHYVNGIVDQTARWGNKLTLNATRARDAERYLGVRLGVKF